MPTYTWNGIDHDGKKINGVDFANNRQQLKKELGKQNIFPLKIELKASLTFWRNSKIKTKHITVFIEQLAILTNANTPLIAAFNIINQDEKNENLKNLILTCKNSIFAGQSLSKTLQQHPQYFNKLLCNLINVGEQSGSLDIILSELANHFTKIAIQKRKIIKTLLYPIAVLSITFIITIILLLFVIPQFKIMYSNLDANLPAYTQFIIKLGECLQEHWIFIFSSITGILACLKLAYQHSTKFRQYLDDLSLKVPLINKVLTYAIIIRLTKTIGLSFKSGMPLLKAINISTDTIQNWRYRAAMEKITRSIANGKTFHGAMEEQKLFPTKVIQLIMLGEETGKLDTMLAKIAAIYDEELNNISDSLNNLLEPIITLILSFIVGGLIIGMYLPIFRLGMVI